MKFGNRTLAVAFSFALAVLLGVGVIGYRNTRLLAASERQVAHTYEVLGQLERLLLTVSDAVSSRRAFALSGEPALLAPYEAGLRTAPKELARLRELTADNLDQQKRLDEFERLMNRRLSQLLETGDGSRPGQPAVPDGGRATTLEGAAMGAELRRSASEFAEAESLLLRERQRRSATSTRDTLIGCALGLALSVAILAAIFTVLRREVRERTETQAELDRYFTQSLELLCIADFDGRFKRLNPAWKTTLGYSIAELCAEPFISFVHPDDQEKTLFESARLSAEGIESVSFVNRFRCRDGSYRWLQWTSMPDRERHLVYSTARDITEARLAESRISLLNQELQKRLTQVEAVNHELEAFSYSVSHDLRSPLRSMDGFSQAVLEDYRDKLDERGVDYLQRIRGAAIRMGELIDALLALARVARAELRSVEVDLTQVAEDVVAEFRRAEPDRVVAVTIAAGLKALGDPVLLRLALQNLLGNAWKYTSKLPEAHVELGEERRSDGRRVLFVKDDGAGFDMAYAGKLFGAFQRLHPVREFAGTGVGLATVKRIFLRHGGEVWAESEVGHGATFFFTLEVPSAIGSSPVEAAESGSSAD